MFGATREKPRLWLLILVGVVATLVGQTHAREIFAPLPSASGEITASTPASTEDFYDADRYDVPDSLLAAKTTPKWPNTAQEMDEFLKLPGQKIPDAPTTPGRDKTMWQPNKDTKITHEQHPYHPDAPDWHKNPHWHLDTPAKKHERFLPGDDIPGY